MLWKHQARLAAIKPLIKMGPAPRFASRAPWLDSLLREGKQPPLPTLYAWSAANIPNGAAARSTSPPSNEDTLDLDKRVYILGAGNMGRLYADSLRDHPDQPPVTLVVHRRELLSQWLDSGGGISIQRGGITHTHRDLDLEWWTEEPPTHGPVREAALGDKARNLVIATKASAVMPQIDRLRRYLDESSTVALLQNGMSPLWPPSGLEYVLQRFEPIHAPNFIACMNNHGVYSLGTFSSVHASPADTAVGPVLLNASAGSPAPSIGYLSGLLSTGPHLSARAVGGPDLWVLQLKKLVVNSTINSLTAVLRCKNGDVIDDKSAPVRPVIDRLIVEMSQTLQALIHSKSVDCILDPPTLPGPASQAHDIPKGAKKPLAALRSDLTTLFSFSELRDHVLRVWELVRENNSSMFQDIRAGKTTEIRDLNGWIVATASFLEQEAREDGKTLTLDVSTNQRLIDLVEAGTAMNAVQLAKHLLSPP